MPIIIARNGPIIPKEDPPYTQEQKDRAWAYIVKAWTEKNQEQFMAMLNPTESESENE